ncbi:MAG: acetate--CoA ligase family protein [Burkholderiaceae bacterium]
MSEPPRNWGDAAFAPRRVALVGASGDLGKAGRLLMDNLLAHGRREIVPIHPSAKEIMGLVAYPKLAAVPGPIDLAVIVTPAHTMPLVIADCALAKVPVALILSGGFAETGPEGAALEVEIKGIAREGGVRLIGPNCFGLIDVQQGINASLAMGLPSSGGVALFTQSGSYGMAAFSRSQDGAIGFSKVLAAGNKADVSEVDAIRYFGADPATRVIALVLESISDGVALVAALREVTPIKPVVILKTGRGSAGKRAAASHTAALAQDFSVARSVLRQAGAVLVDDGLSLFDVAAALDRQPPRRGNRVAIITNSGGTGVELADLLEVEGLDVPALSAPLRDSIAKHLPAHGAAGNPIDVTTDWKRFPAMYRESLRALLASHEVDAVIPVLLQRSALDEGVVDAVIEETRDAALQDHAKPVHVCWVAPSHGDALRRKLQNAGLPCHEWAARTVRVLARCVATSVTAPPDIGTLLDAPHDVPADGWLEPQALFALLQAWGLPIAPWRMAADAQAAVTAAAELGYPAVLKAVRPGLVHKTEVGAVRLGLGDAAAVRDAFASLSDTLGAGPVLVQAQAARGVELVLGATRDPTFGPLVLCGLGGIWMETLHDVALRAAPIDEIEAQRALTELRGGALLDGARGAPGVDRGTLAALLAKLSVAVARAPWCAELNLNPVIAGGNRFVIVDARLRVEVPKA